MFKKTAYILSCSLGLIMISCNSKETKTPVQQSAPQQEATHSDQAQNEELSLLEKKLAMDSLNVEILAELASKYYAAGVLDKAATHFLTIIRHDPENLYALSNLGNVYYDSQQNENAILFYEKALNKDPKNINMRCDLATCYSRIKKMNKAIQILKENIKMDVNHAQSHHNLSVILIQNGNKAEGEAELKRYNDIMAATKK